MKQLLFWGILVLSLFSFNTLFFSHGDRQKPLSTITEVYQAHPQRMHQLIDQLDLESPLIEIVKKHLLDKDTVEACDALLKSIQDYDADWVVEALDPLSTSDAMRVANALIGDSVLIHEVADKMPRNADGWQWNHLGPLSDAEFAYSLNAQSYLPSLYTAWKQTAKDDYVRVFNQIVQDWIIQHPIPDPRDSIYLVLNNIDNIDYRDIGEVEWRTLDTGRRLGASWPQLFFAFYDHPRFTAATKLLMLASIAEQAQYLHQYHKSNHNWTTMEMNGLALVGLAFPIFRDARLWSDYALKTMTDEINRQVYPDGVQTELSTKTQWVALRRFESLANNFRSAGQEIKESYLRRIEEMYSYLAYCMRPDGHQPLNNDSDREDLRPRVLEAAETYGRSDWRYIATNGHSETKPSEGPSLTFPWAGISIFRNGWTRDSDWTFFDIGPYGTGHQHRDMLHISIAAFGQDLLVDGGRYTHRNYFSFDPTVWRGYFRSSHSHNTILINGQGQKPGPLTAIQPKLEHADFLHSPEFDFAKGTFTNGYENQVGKAHHIRSVLYLKNHQWLVIDRIELENPSEIQALWHLYPNASVSWEDQILNSLIGDSIYFSIYPLSDFDWEIQTVVGQESPHIQGWYSPTYDVKKPNPALIYQAQIQESDIFCWLMIASKVTNQDASPVFTKNTHDLNITYQYEKQETQIQFPLSFNPPEIKVNISN